MMLDATLRERARGLADGVGAQQCSARMVNDGEAAAARIEAAGGHVIHMEVGQPAASAPKAAISAATQRSHAGRIDYTSALGMPSLRRAHRRALPRRLRLRRRCGADRGPTGSSGAFILGFLAMFEPGDRLR